MPAGVASHTVIAWAGQQDTAPAPLFGAARVGAIGAASAGGCWLPGHGSSGGAGGFFRRAGRGGVDLPVDRKGLPRVRGGFAQAAVLEVVLAESFQGACWPEGCAAVARDGESLGVVAASGRLPLYRRTCASRYRCNPRSGENGARTAAAAVARPSTVTLSRETVAREQGV